MSWTTNALQQTENPKPLASKRLSMEQRPEGLVVEHIVGDYCYPSDPLVTPQRAKQNLPPSTLCFPKGLVCVQTGFLCVLFKPHPVEPQLPTEKEENDMR